MERRIARCTQALIYGAFRVRLDAGAGVDVPRSTTSTCSACGRCGCSCADEPYTPLPFKTPLLYRYVRHPLYVGWFFAFWSTPTMTVAHLVFAIATTAYILIAIQLEERDLIAEHPEYAQYRKRVPMLVPFTKARRSAAVDGALPITRSESLTWSRSRRIRSSARGSQLIRSNPDPNLEGETHMFFEEHVHAALAMAAPIAGMAGDITPPAVPGNLAVQQGSKAFAIGHAVGTQQLRLPARRRVAEVGPVQSAGDGVRRGRRADHDALPQPEPCREQCCSRHVATLEHDQRGVGREARGVG